jgi:hypothetical protein
MTHIYMLKQAHLFVNNLTFAIDILRSEKLIKTAATKYLQRFSAKTHIPLNQDCLKDTCLKTPLKSI